jgi:2-dehydropantoate 2-reductase
MKVLVLGAGVIGTTYAYALQKAGHQVEHFIRASNRSKIEKTINVQLLDGRETSDGIEREGAYSLVFTKPGSSYDFILLSLSAGKLEGAVKTLAENNISGTAVVFSGIWEDRDFVSKAMGGYPYVLGYPVAGGSITKDSLNCVLFDHIMLESKEKSAIPKYPALVELFSSVHIGIECPYDMLEWIWVHMAINAAVISTAARYGDIDHPEKAAETLIDSVSGLSKAVLAARQTLRIVEARGVDSNRYKDEASPFKAPSLLAGFAMKRMFKKNQLTRRIMLLHGNAADLIYICKSVHDTGRELQVKAPLFYNNYRLLVDKAEVGA